MRCLSRAPNLNAGVRMRRLFGVTAAVAALAIALSGCSLVNDGPKVVTQVQEGFAAHELLTRLTDELRERGDILSADSSVVPVYMSAGVTVRMRGDAAATAIGEVATRIDDALRSPELEPFERQFSVEAGNASFKQTDFTQAPFDFAAELAYWDAVQRTIGPGITLTLGEGRDGSLQRILSTGKDSTVIAIAAHADALTAMVPPNSVETMWRLPGVAGYNDWLGPLPDVRVLTFLATMAGITNLLDDSVQEAPPGVYVNLPGPGVDSAPQFAFIAKEATTKEDSAATRQLGLKMARAALATGLPAFQVAIQTLGNELDEDARIHVGACAELNSMFPPSPADHKLVADLVAGGADLPDTAAGICMTFATP